MDRWTAAQDDATNRLKIKEEMSSLWQSLSMAMNWCFFDKGAVDLCTAWREKLSENEDEIQLSVEIRVLLHYENAKMF